MSRLAAHRVNRGAYSSPFSGVGQEFLPLSIAPDHSGVVLHESGYLQQNAPWNFPNVFSPFWRLYYDFAPGHQVVFKHKTVGLGPDRILLIPSYVRFDCEGVRPVPSLWLSFNCARQCSPNQTVPIELVPTPTEARLIDDLVGLFKRSVGNANEAIFRFSLALLQVVLSRPELAWSEQPPEGLTRTLRYIEERFASELYTQELCRVAGMSPRSFTRLFRQHQGITAAQFIAQVRVRKAAHLLLTTEANLDEVAERTGFRDRTYFTRIFKRLTQVTPAGFRRKHRAGPGPSGRPLFSRSAR